jgi:hypothetical protein
LLEVESSAEPVPVAMNVLATIFPEAKTFEAVKLIVPPETMFKLPVEFNVPDVAKGEITVFATTFPALILPVYVVRNEAIFALPKLTVAGFAAR